MCDNVMADEINQEVMQKGLGISLKYCVLAWNTIPWLSGNIIAECPQCGECFCMLDDGEAHDAKIIENGGICPDIKREMI